MNSWWGSYDVAAGQTLRWQIGPTTLWVGRRHVEWIIGHVVGRNPADSRLVVAEDSKSPDEGEAEVTRFALEGASGTLKISAALPDRPVIFRAENPFFIPSGEEATLFVSSPLWFRIDVGTASAALLDLPLQRPSDTWFGPDTRTGDLCYASRTAARLDLAELPVRPHRAITSVRIINRASSNLPLEKLKVPVTGLELFCSGDGHLWTAALTFERLEDHDQARVRVTDRPKTAGDLTPVSPARTPASRGALIDVFGGFLGRRMPL